jgi:hypothetical protein
MIQVIKSRRIICERIVAHKADRRYAHRTFGEEIRGKETASKI